MKELIAGDLVNVCIEGDWGMPGSVEALAIYLGRRVGLNAFESSGRGSELITVFIDDHISEYTPNWVSIA